LADAAGLKCRLFFENFVFIPVDGVDIFKKKMLAGMEMKNNLKSGIIGRNDWGVIERQSSAYIGSIHRKNGKLAVAVKHR